MTKYQVKGTTDDVTQCMNCGRPDLRATVMLGVLDADGNVEDVVYYGTDCAARVTGRKQAAIKREAQAADHEHAQRVEWAQGIIAVYGPVEGDVRETARVFFERNPQMRHRLRASVAVADMLTEARAALAGV
jgi:hypothetical protein